MHLLSVESCNFRMLGTNGPLHPDRHGVQVENPRYSVGGWKPYEFLRRATIHQNGGDVYVSHLRCGRWPITSKPGKTESP